MYVIAVLAALGAVVSVLTPRVPVAPAAEAAGAVSLAITAAHPLLGRQDSAPLWMMAEVLALMTLVLLAARRAPGRRVVSAVGLPGAAIALVLMRALWPGEPSLMVTGCAGWSLLAVAAAALGLYMRSLDSARRRAVAGAEREQRLALARDLHDYVAHDVNGMLVQAQAARTVPGPLPPAVADALRRIEEAGVRALASMDRTLEMLHDRPGAGRDRHLPGVEGLEGLVDGFSPPVLLTVDPGLDLSRETSATVYRVVTEALTNVRRHAGQATRVQVEVTAQGRSVRVRIADDGGGGRSEADGRGGRSDGARRGGFGLAGLTERAGVLGGSLSAGPTRDGWHVTALLPAKAPHEDAA
ncbi:two-component system sensor histidine kinase [Planomonospora sphaerica]|uniref:histidine kinase n=1 Tax=Planomonospora sphaerica TaxID=161355 RepID=A0A161LIG5_9ACTN|nr:histidine kinase [Planomonospora sphaerica]GAT65975.1 two-component system sensor histidine kinase [Planomonospora sphaerica]